jgi:uncharacterized protein (DUF58 family)
MTATTTAPSRNPGGKPSGAWLTRLGPQMRALFGRLHHAVIAGGGANAITSGMTDPDPQRYLDPETLARVGLSPMLARLVVEGFLNGLHKSPFHGFSVEFADHREYVPGDDLKYLDWALYARTDGFYIKRYEEETNLRCYIVLDRSASMAFGTGKLTKWDYSCFLSTCLAYLMLKQQDAVGLALFGARPGIMVPPRVRNAHLNQMMRVMITNAPTGVTDVAASLRAILRNVKRRGLVVVVSDLIDDPEGTLQAIRLLRSHRHDVIVFHVQDPAELEFSFDGATLFRDMETGEEIEIDPAAVRQTYLHEINELCAIYRKGFTEVGIDYQLINTRQPYDQALSAYMRRRAKTRK